MEVRFGYNDTAVRLVVLGPAVSMVSVGPEGHGAARTRLDADNGSVSLDRSPVCTENLILIDYVTESPIVNGDDRAALLLPGPVRLAVQVEEPT